MDMSDFQLTDNVAVVIGGNSGIGRGIALGLAEAGAHVVPASRNQEHIKETVKMITDCNRRSIAVPADATKKDELENLCRKVIEEFGTIDILVNSAGTVFSTPFLDMNDDQYDETLRINLKAAVLACQVFGKIMTDNRKGKIINISSMAAYWGEPDIVAYCISKGGITQLTKSLAVEFAPYNVQVNAIAPGFVVTPLTEKVFTKPEIQEKLTGKTPMGRYGDPEDFQGAAVFLSSRASDFITGQTICVDGGLLVSGRK